MLVAVENPRAREGQEALEAAENMAGEQFNSPFRIKFNALKVVSVNI